MNSPDLLSRLSKGVGGAVLALATLASCGGGSSLYQSFTPSRVIVFGDENSLILSDGRKYTTNTYTPGIGLQCGSQPVWAQYLATYYGLYFPQCNPQAVASPQARMQAAYGAVADDLPAQVDAFQAGDSLQSSDFVTVMLGQNDVLEEYARYPAETEDTITTELQARGQRLATEINIIAGTGAKVIVSTIPDIGLTPFGQAQKLNNTDTDRAALLSRLTDAINLSMRANIINDGTKIGLVLADDFVRSAVRSPGSYGYSDVVDPICVVALPDCNTQTLVSNAVVTTYLWADATHLSGSGQQQIGNLAVNRARGNPF
jgi:phospholipase/lecithinase/hemolysin